MHSDTQDNIAKSLWKAGNWLATGFIRAFSCCFNRRRTLDDEMMAGIPNYNPHQPLRMQAKQLENNASDQEGSAHLSSGSGQTTEIKTLAESHNIAAQPLTSSTQPNSSPFIPSFTFGIGCPGPQPRPITNPNSTLVFSANPNLTAAHSLLPANNTGHKNSDATLTDTENSGIDNEHYECVNVSNSEITQPTIVANNPTMNTVPATISQTAEAPLRRRGWLF